MSTRRFRYRGEGDEVKGEEELLVVKGLETNCWRRMLGVRCGVQGVGCGV